MVRYYKLPYWENRRRTRLLRDTRERLVIYYSGTKPTGFGSGVLEAQHDSSADEAREWLNRHLLDLHRCLTEAGVGTVVSFTPPPMIGGPTQVVDIIHNLFRAQGVQMTPRMMLDLFDQALGVYEADAGRAKARSFNPLFWFGLGIEWIVRLPFALLGSVGFNRDRAEDSVLGRLAKSIGVLAGWLAAVLTALELLGVLGPLRAFVKGLVRPN